MPYIGQITMFACSFAPNNWQACEGQYLSVPAYRPLFNVIATTFGGNGTSNFELPDLRGISPLGAGAGPGLTPRSVGDKGGRVDVILNNDQLAVHTHAPNASLDGTVNSPANSVWAAQGNVRPAPDQFAPAMTNPQGLTPGNIGSTGSGYPHNNLMPYQVLTICICSTGD